METQEFIVKLTVTILILGPWYIFIATHTRKLYRGMFGQDEIPQFPEMVLFFWLIAAPPALVSAWLWVPFVDSVLARDILLGILGMGLTGKVANDKWGSNGKPAKAKAPPPPPPS